MQRSNFQLRKMGQKDALIFRNMTVEVQPAGEYVRARESSETEVCAIGAATNRLHLWLHASHLDGLFGDVHDPHVRLHLLAHIVILVFYFCAGRSVAIFFVDEIHAFLHESLLLLEAFAEVVADYVRIMYLSVASSTVPPKPMT